MPRTSSIGSVVPPEVIKTFIFHQFLLELLSFYPIKNVFSREVYLLKKLLTADIKKPSFTDSFY
ncbi:hypothetical protein NCDO763_2262 [Lactococcus cremoris]|nr:hypothetical protein N41_1632 [Lactococcus cremoris]KZK43940.1 hypothetical protein LMG6897_0025 [Lactococcus cremoris]KZK45695.1 hypothetical protein FG2_1653 [Lactococcus cremoris]KZK49248.1 hypothetical protein NCDO763_2262 [Lactococcus cremoris]